MSATERPVVDLSARRRAKVAAVRPTTQEERLVEADNLLLHLAHLAEEELLVDGVEVRDLAKRAGRLIVDCLLDERDRREAR